MNEMRNLGQFLQHFIEHGTAIESLAGVGVAIGRKNQLGLNLLKAIEHDGDTHLWRATGPDGANAGAGQKRHHGLRHIGEISDYTVTGRYAQTAQGGSQRTHIALQLLP